MTKVKQMYTIAGWIAVVYMILFFLYPVFKVVVTSVWVNDSFTLGNYISIFSKELYTTVLIKTLWIAIVSTLISVFIGYTLAYFISNQPSQKQGVWLLLVVSTMFVSLTVRLFGWMILLGGKGPIVGIINYIFGEEKAVPLLFSSIAVIIGIVHFVIPFVVLNIYTTLKKLEPSLIEASTMLGVSRWRTFWKVIFPLSLPGVYAGGSVAFALSASTYLVPIMLGGPKDNLLSNMAYNSTVVIGNMGIGAALSFVLLIIIVAVLTVIGMIERRGHSEAKMG